MDMITEKAKELRKEIQRYREGRNYRGLPSAAETNLTNQFWHELINNSEPTLYDFENYATGVVLTTETQFIIMKKAGFWRVPWYKRLRRFFIALFKREDG